MVSPPSAASTAGRRAADPVLLATVAAGLKAKEITKLERKAFRGVGAEYLACRAAILAAWARDDTRFFTEGEAVTACPSEDRALASKAYRFLSRQGSINSGLVRGDPRVPLLRGFVQRGGAGSDEGDVAREEGGGASTNDFGRKADMEGPWPAVEGPGCRTKTEDGATAVREGGRTCVVAGEASPRAARATAVERAEPEVAEAAEAGERVGRGSAHGAATWASKVRTGEAGAAHGAALPWRAEAGNDDETEEKPVVPSAPEVVIIGGGPAGLSAALHLRRHGIDALVLEARSRPGGRVATLRDESRFGPTPVDIGASIVTGTAADVARETRAEPLAQLARQLGFPLRPLQSELIIFDGVEGGRVDPVLDARVERLHNLLMDDVARRIEEDEAPELLDGENYGHLLEEALQERLARGKGLFGENAEEGGEKPPKRRHRKKLRGPAGTGGCGDLEEGGRENGNEKPADEGDERAGSGEEGPGGDGGDVKDRGVDDGEGEGSASEGRSDRGTHGAASRGDAPGRSTPRGARPADEAIDGAETAPAASETEREARATAAEGVAAGGGDDAPAGAPAEGGREAPAGTPVGEGGDAPAGEPASLSAVERRLLHWHWAHLEYGCSAPLDKLSARHWNQDEEFGGFGGPHKCSVRGLGGLMEGLAAHVPVIYMAEVAEIRDRSGRRVLRTERGRSTEARVLGSTAGGGSPPQALAAAPATASTAGSAAAPATASTAGSAAASKAEGWSVPASEPHVQAVLRDGRTIPARAAIVAVPLGVLASGRLAFEPALPGWKSEALARLGAGRLNKAALAFEEKFWPEGMDWFGVARGEGRVERGAGFFFWDATRWAALDEWDDAGAGERGGDARGREGAASPALPTSPRAPARPHVLLALGSGAFAEVQDAWEGSDDEARSSPLVRAALEALRGAFGATTVPEPSGVHATRWGADPSALCSYSYVAVGADERDYEAAALPAGRAIFFAGEHTSREHPDTVGGAMLSGICAATATLDFLLGPVRGATVDVGAGDPPIRSPVPPDTGIDAPLAPRPAALADPPPPTSRAPAGVKRAAKRAAKRPRSRTAAKATPAPPPEPCRAPAALDCCAAPPADVAELAREPDQEEGALTSRSGTP